MRGHATFLAAATLVAAALFLSGTGAAQNVPTPDANDLGVSQNDVRDEPNHRDDENGFPHQEFSPATETQILEGYIENGPVEEDYSNLLNVLLHGEEISSYEQYMIPGLVSYEAYWGWWADAGAGGDLQNSSLTSDTILADDEGNGAIDDAPDCSQDPWEEFVWRGPNNDCASEHGYTTHQDSMLAFIEPGSHDIQILSLGLGLTDPTPVETVLSSEHDGRTQADFAYGNADSGQGWEAAFGWSRIEYDSSLLVATQVTTSVNPASIPGDSSAFEPFDSTAHDVDVYTNLHPTVEDAYRMTVWDPPQDYGDDEDEENLVSERGPKGIAKGPVNTAYVGAKDDAGDLVAEQSPNAIAGFARNLVQGPHLHEPTTAMDQFGYVADSDGDGEPEPEDWATFDPATSYGGLDDDDNDGEQEYYEPGPDQTYTGYQEGERFWADALVSVNLEPNWAVVVGVPEGRHVTPELPNPDEPAQSLSEEEDDQTTAPGFVYLQGHFGTWFDANGDTFVGEATDPPYQQGVTLRPHDYYDASEFRGVGTGNLEATTTLVPLNDTDGDGVNDWGAAGVYYLNYMTGNPYSDAAVDVLGNDADPVLDPLRENSEVGGAVSFVAPDDEDGRLSRHHLTGNITFENWFWNENEQPAGEWNTADMLLFPTGSMDIWFKAVTEVTLTGDRLGEHGDTDGASLTGQSVKDVDIIRSIQSTSG